MGGCPGWLHSMSGRAWDESGEYPDLDTWTPDPVGRFHPAFSRSGSGYVYGGQIRQHSSKPQQQRLQQSRRNGGKHFEQDWRGEKVHEHTTTCEAHQSFHVSSVLSRCVCVVAVQIRNE